MALKLSELKKGQYQIEGQDEGTQAPLKLSQLDPEKHDIKIEENELPEEKSLLSKFGSGVADIARGAVEKYDSYLTSPLRSAVGAYQDDKNPAAAYLEQMGEPGANAPSGKDLMLKAGVSDEPMFKTKGSSVLDAVKKYGPSFGPLGQLAAIGANNAPQGLKDMPIEPSPADVAGFGAEVGLDPTNVIGVGAVAKLGAKALGATARGVGKVAAGAGNLAARVSRTERLAKYAKDTAKETFRELENVYKPKHAPTFERYAEIAQKNGINPELLPESIRFGPGSPGDSIGRSVRENAFTGGAEVERFKEGWRAVQDATDKHISTIGGGPPLTDVEAGAMLRDGYDEALDRLFDDVDFTYDEVIRQSPGISLTAASKAALDSKLNGLEKFAKGRVMRGFTQTDRTQGEQIIKAVESIREGNGSLKHLHESMTDIGRHAFKEGQNAFADIPIDQEKFQDLYFTLRDEFLNSTASQLGDDVAQSLIDSNELITQFNKNKAVVSKLIGNKHLANEKLFNSLVVRGDTKKAQAIREIYTPEQIQRLKGAMLEHLIKRDPDGSFGMGTLHSAMENKRAIISELFDKSEILPFAELVELGDKFGPMQLSTSRTGSSNILNNTYQGLKSGLANKSTLALMKEKAAARAAQAPEALRALSPGQSSNSRVFFNRSGPDEAAKYMQMLGALEASKNPDEDTAARRRMEALIHQRMNK